LSPLVEETAPGLVTVDVRGRTRASGKRCRPGELRFEMAERCQEALRADGLHLRGGLGQTPDHAAWAGLRGMPVFAADALTPFLESLRISLAGFDRRELNILERWGIRTMGEFRRLPRCEITRRLGQRGAEVLGRINGETVRPLRQVAWEHSFARQGSFEFRLENMEALRFLMRRYVDELALEMQVRQVAAKGCILSLKLERGSTFYKHLNLPEPTSRSETLFRVLVNALEGVQLSAPIVGLALELDTCRMAYQQRELFALAMEDSAGFVRTADQLAGLLGSSRIGTPRVANSWRPDAFTMERLSHHRSTLGAKSTEVRSPPLYGLPLRRFRPPRLVQVWTEQARPVLLQKSSDFDGALRGLRGPWRSSGAWWTELPWAREEWDVESENGALLRIFRESAAWWLDGVYG